MWCRVMTYHKMKHLKTTLQSIMIRSIETQTSQNEYSFLTSLQTSLNVTETEAKCILNKCPSLSKLTKEQIDKIIVVINGMGFDKQDIIRRPKLLNQPPLTLQYRKEILNECGILDVNIDVLSSYLNIVKKITISQLKTDNLLPADIKVEERLLGKMPNRKKPCLCTQEENTSTLLNLRMSVLQRYLQDKIDLSLDKFNRGLRVYPRIKSRPFRIISETISLLEMELNMPISKIRSNLCLVYADPENIKHLIYKLKSIAGIDMKKLLLRRPIFCNTSYKTFIETKHLLDNYKISEEAQSKHLDVYLLGTHSLQKRLEEATSIPQFNALLDNPRILKLIIYRKKAKARLKELSESNKKCHSLHVLSGEKSTYETYARAPGDKTKGIDFITGIAQKMGKGYHTTLVRNEIRKHPFWLSIPLAEAKLVFDNLITKFALSDIFLNLHILLYPWKKVHPILNSVMIGEHINTQDSDQVFTTVRFLDGLNCIALSKPQILSLTVYFLEKEYYFSGNGVWNEKKSE